MNELYRKRLTELRARSGLLLGTKSITRMEAFLNGYAASLIDCELMEKSAPQEMMLFWLWLRLHFKQSYSVSWGDIILIEAGKDEAKAFDMFWELWDRYERAVKEKGPGQIRAEHDAWLKADLEQCMEEFEKELDAGVYDSDPEEPSSGGTSGKANGP